MSKPTYHRPDSTMAIIKRKPEIAMTAENLQLAFYRSEKHRFELLVANVYLKGWLECDLVGVRHNGLVDEIEIKLSRPDFRADFGKKVSSSGMVVGKHELLAAGEGAINRFWFMTPASLLSESDIPAYAGLIEVTTRGSLCVVKEAPLLHRRKADDAFRVNCLRQQGWRVWDYMTGERTTREGERQTEESRVGEES